MTAKSSGSKRISIKQALGLFLVASLLVLACPTKPSPPPPPPPADDHSDSANGATPIAVNGSPGTGYIEEDRDRDFFRFDAVQGMQYRLSLGGLRDLEVVLYGTNGTTPIDSSTNANVGGNAEIDWTCPASGTYFVMAHHFFTYLSGLGQYTLSVTSSSQVGVPTANAGDDQLVNMLTEVQLDGSGSSNSTGGLLQYKWELLSGPVTMIANPTSTSPTITPGEAGTYEIGLTVINDDQIEDSDTVVITAQPLPSVTISSPTLDTSISVDQPEIAVGGVVSTTVEDISLSTELVTKAAKIVPNEDGSFLFEQVTLMAGDNRITVTATDNLGATATAALSVVYNAAGAFDGPLTVDPFAAIEDTPTDVVFQVSLPVGLLPNAISVVLNSVDADGAFLALASAMVDDGTAANGDETAGDGLYSAKLSIDKSDPGTLFYRASATINDGSGPENIFTPTVEFEILPDIPFTAFEAAETRLLQAASAIPTDGEKISYDEYFELLFAIANDLESDGNVLSANVTPDYRNIVVTFVSGVTTILAFDDGFVTSAKASSALPSSNSPEPAMRLVNSPFDPTNDVITSRTVSAWFPFADEHVEFDMGYMAISEVWGFNTRVRREGSMATINELRDMLDKDGAILIWTHGGSNGKFGWLKTKATLTEEKYAELKSELIAGGLVGSLEYICKYASDGVTIESKTAFRSIYIFDRWFELQKPVASKRHKPVVMLAACRTFVAPALPASILKAGAGFVVGFTDNVNASVVETYEDDFIDLMVAENFAAGDAWDIVTNAYGPGISFTTEDGKRYTPFFFYDGNPNLRFKSVPEIAGLWFGHYFAPETSDADVYMLFEDNGFVHYQQTSSLPDSDGIKPTVASGGTYSFKTQSDGSWSVTLTSGSLCLSTSGYFNFDEDDFVICDRNVLPGSVIASGSIADLESGRIVVLESFIPGGLELTNPTIVP